MKFFDRHLPKNFLDIYYEYRLHILEININLASLKVKCLSNTSVPNVKAS